MSDTHHPLHRRLLRLAFRQLYTTFAFAYDAVASAVSLGEWQEWGRTAMRFLPEGTPEALAVLELAHGPGHLQLAMRQAGYRAVGLDLSPQMSALALHRLRRAGLLSSLVRASVFALPFPTGRFGACISTFPTEFIHSPQVLREVSRVLVERGRFIVIPAAPLRLRSATERTVQLAYTATGQGQSRSTPSKVGDLFAQAGFEFREQRVSTQHAVVIVWVGIK